MQQLWHALRASLRRMDEEATTLYSAEGLTWSSGLRQYHYHWRAVHPSSKRRCEPAWSQRLAQLLNDGGIRSQAEGRGVNGYPPHALLPGSKRAKCDLVTSVDEPLDTWIEVKGAWPVCFRASSTGAREPYAFSRFRGYLLESTVKDFRKLELLQRPFANRIGVLLVSFDGPLASVDEHESELTKAIDPAWERFSPATWTEPHFGTRVSVRFWHRLTPGSS